MATLADVRADIEKNGERYGVRPADFAQAIDRLAEITRRDLSKIQATLPVVNGMLQSLLWQNHGFKSQKAHDNWRALVRGAVKKSQEERKVWILCSPKKYPAEWKSFIAAVDQAVKDGKVSKFQRADLSCIPAWCAANEIAPDEFDHAAAKAMADWYIKHRPSKGRRPNRYIKQGIRAWNAIAALGIGGIAEVKRPIGRGRTKYIQLDEMPGSLIDDIEAYVNYTRTRSSVAGETVQRKPAAKSTAAGRFAHLRGTIIRDVAVEERSTKKKSGRPLGPVSEETVKATYHAMRILVSAGARRVENEADGVLPPIPLVEGIRLAAFLNKNTMLDGCILLEEGMREEGKVDEDTDDAEMPASCHTFGAKVCAVATWAKIDPEELGEMRVAIGSSVVRTDSVDQMPADRRAILDRMDDSRMVLAWFRAPTALWDRAERERRSGGIMDWEVVRDAETAFIAWLLSRLPLRRKNICQLTIRCIDKEEAMIRLARFDGEQSVLVIPGRFVKNGRPIRFVIKGEGEKMLRGLLAKGGYREAAMAMGGFEDTPFLFVGASHSFIKKRIRVTGHRSFSAIGAGYRDRMREFGINTTLHIARHIAAQIALDFDPDAIEVVANLLGSSVKTVEKHYVSNRTSKAAEKFDEIIRGSIGKALKMLSEGRED